MYRGSEFNREWMEPTTYCIMGIMAWTLATILLYAMTSMRLRWLTNRTAFLPEAGVDWHVYRGRTGGGSEPLPPLQALPWALPVGEQAQALEVPADGKANK
jgi:hypothetical protein